MKCAIAKRMDKRLEGLPVHRVCPLVFLVGETVTHSFAQNEMIQQNVMNT